MAASIRLSAVAAKARFPQKYSKCFTSPALRRFTAAKILTLKSRSLIGQRKYVLVERFGRIFWSLPDRCLGQLSPQACWNCGVDVHISDFVCKKCDCLQEGFRKLNYFEVFGEAPRYDIDSGKLQDKLHGLQKVLHPDKFAAKSQKERDLSDDMSALVNQAYQTLSKPEKRAKYLLDLHGKDLQAVQLDACFLGRMMELNEQVAEVEEQRDTKSAKEYLKVVKVEADVLTKELMAHFEADNFDEACTCLAKIKYFRNIEGKLRNVLGP